MVEENKQAERQVDARKGPIIRCKFAYVQIWKIKNVNYKIKLKLQNLKKN